MPREGEAKREERAHAGGSARGGLLCGGQGEWGAGKRPGAGAGGAGPVCSRRAGNLWGEGQALRWDLPRPGAALGRDRLC